MPHLRISELDVVQGSRGHFARLTTEVVHAQPRGRTLARTAGLAGAPCYTVVGSEARDRELLVQSRGCSSIGRAQRWQC